MSMAQKQELLAWHFATDDRKLRFGDNRAIAIGETHRVRGKPIMCEHGLHGSVRPIDALSYAPGPIVYRVKLHGTILEGNDKACATARTYVAGGIDATEELRSFARWCALQVVHLWDCPPIVKQYLETGDESIRAAAWDAVRAAAWAAAWAAVRAAARDAAWDAVRDAACDAAWDAACDAAWAAAWDAVRAAAWDAAKAAFIDQFNVELERRLLTLIEAAA